MKVQHFFLSNDPASVPERWHQAFARGQVLDAPALLAHLRAERELSSLIWLSSADAQCLLYLQQILHIQPGARVVLVSGAPDPVEGLKAINAGVRGYAHAYAVPALLQEVATVVEHGGLWVGPDLLQRLVGSTSAALARLGTSARSAVSEVPVPVAPAAPIANPWPLLSAREAQVARAVSAGRSNKEVADLMFISERTVKAHLGAVFEKLGVRDRLQLVLRLAAFAELAPMSTVESTL
jgi:DNA-binding NarL/FixJ family response regulator